MKEKSRFQIGTGITSILMIFIVLCLTAFGVLSLSTANADLNLTKKSEKNIEKNYECYSECMKAYGMIDEQIYRLREVYDGKTDYMQYILSNIETIKKSVNTDKINVNTEKAETGKLVIQCEINSKQTMNMELSISDTDDKNRVSIEKCYIKINAGNYQDGGENLIEF